MAMLSKSRSPRVALARLHNFKRHWPDDVNHRAFVIVSITGLEVVFWFDVPRGTLLKGIDCW